MPDPYIFPNQRPISGMVDRIEKARRLVADASEDADKRDIHEQLNSIDEGLQVLDDAESENEVKGDRLEEVEEKLVGLGNQVDDESVLRRIEDARDHIDAYRREETQDW